MITINFCSHSRSDYTDTLSFEADRFDLTFVAFSVGTAREIESSIMRGPWVLLQELLHNLESNDIALDEKYPSLLVVFFLKGLLNALKEDRLSSGG